MRGFLLTGLRRGVWTAAVLSCLAALVMIGCDNPAGADAEGDRTAPVIPDSIVVGTRGTDSVAFSWGAAVDDTTPQGGLEYKAVRAPEAGLLATVGGADSQTVVMGWTPGVLGATATGLTPDTTYWFAVLVRDAAGNTSLYEARSAHTLNATAPNPGTGPSYGSIAQESVSVSWTAASDDVTPQGTLQYKLVRADSAASIDTVDEADAVTGPALVMDWSTGTLTRTATGLTPFTAYWFAVLVKDAEGNRSLYAPRQVTTLGQEYTVTFNSQGGTAPSPASKTVNHGSTYGTLATTTRTGYTFGGWWTGEGGIGTQILPATTVSAEWNHTLYAKWTVNTYTVTFDAQGGTAPSPASKTVTYGSTYGALASTARPGYTSGGWWTGAGGTGTQILTATTVSTASDHTLYAKWTANTYTVTFDAQGGTAPSPASKTVTYGSAYGALATTSKTGYYLDGWRTAAGGAGALIQPATIVAHTSNHTLYAAWAPNTAAFAKSVETPAASRSAFHAVATDGSGNIYAAGFQKGNASYSYGSTVSVSASGNNWANAVLVKYNSSGEALWARVVSSGEDSVFYGVAVGDGGNVYVVGYQGGTAGYGYGSTWISATGGSAMSPVLVKFDPSGTALWARSTSAGAAGTFLSVAYQSTGYVYAAGYQVGTGAYNYGSLSVSGTSVGTNASLVKYNTSGTEMWGKSTYEDGASDSVFNSLAVDGSGNIWAVGSQKGTGTYSYGTNAGIKTSAAGPASGTNALIVKYSSAADCIAARTVSSGTGSSEFYAIAMDGSGYPYAAGRQNGTGTFTYNGISAAGASSAENIILVKYSSNLGSNAQWARSVSAGSSGSEFRGLAISGTNVYAAGRQTGTGSYTYGSGVTATGAYDGVEGNAALVKYNTSGTAQWARSTMTAPGASAFRGASVSGSGNVAAAGYQFGAGSYVYGGAAAAGWANPMENAALVGWLP